MGIALANEDFFVADAGGVVVLTAAMAASGAGIGALIGLIVRTKEWEEIPLPPRAPVKYAE